MNIVQSTTPPTLSADLIAKFRNIVGDKYAVTDPADIAPYTTEERDLFHGHSPLVLRPGSTAEVAAICKLASEHKIALVPQGGNTGLVGGQTPHNGEVVISMRRMDKIRDVEITTSPLCGVCPPTRPVLPPCGTSAILWSFASLQIAATSAVEPGRSTSGERPWNRSRSSVV